MHHVSAGQIGQLSKSHVGDPALNTVVNNQENEPCTNEIKTADQLTSCPCEEEIPYPKPRKTESNEFLPCYTPMHDLNFR